MEKYIRSKQKKAIRNAIIANNDEQFEEKQEQDLIESDMFLIDMEFFNNRFSRLIFEEPESLSEEDLYGSYL